MKITLCDVCLSNHILSLATLKLKWKILGGSKSIDVCHQHKNIITKIEDVEKVLDKSSDAYFEMVEK